MGNHVPRRLAFACALIVALGSPAFAQNQPPQNQQQQQQQADKDAAKKVDEFAEAAAALQGPAGHPECVWLGRRIVNLMWRDDLDTAFRHLELYDRFTCPGGHIQATFRCLVRQGPIDPKQTDSLASRVHQCWMNPALEPATAQAPPAQGQQPQPGPPTTGTNQ
ncbi:hypothetical protein GJW-30_1_03196 [Variibacter gotjawalensis]|uniref:Beta-1-3, beta-1-6-glucan biosynthesis protein n=1 Tax=Variibacter gotjawalensis TaxID=1333996 RepID=A0A0S3PXG9_9BRAD|nr:beta-1-3, beta-1-6-glucan biosynthesis protein [Variibacter gotjawalensis]RZS48389.1 hypothetical protein EV661_0800 [Variibacter gotjawalensis]BAT60648.1 hypothetical protein GJW-30_1_03196 [Variibacter gotjawalensis]